MANKKMKKVIALLAVLAMAATFVPMVAFAAAAVSLDTAEFVPDTNESAIHVKGTLNGGSSLENFGDITLLVVRSDKSLAELNNTIPDLTSNEDMVMFFDQKVDYTEKNGENVECAAEWTTIMLRETDATGDYILVFMGGAEVNGVQCAELRKSTPDESVTVPMVALEEGKDYYVDGEQVLDFADVPQAWLDGVTITVFDGEAEAGTISTLTGNIELNEAPDEAKQYTIKFSSVEGYVDVADKTVKVISADGEKLKNYEGTPAWISNSDDDDNWTISIPASTDDVAITVAQFDGDAAEGTDVTANVTEGVLTVARPDEGSDAKVVVVTATAGNASKVLGTFVVPAKGAAAPAISAEDVVIIASKAYGQNDKTLIAVVTDAIDPETQNMAIGDINLYYSPVKEKYYTVISSDIATSEADIAASIVISDTPSKTLYFGVTVEKAGKVKPVAADFANALKQYLRKPVTLTDKQFIALDAGSAELNGKYNAMDFSALLKYYLKKASDLPVNVK